MKNYTAAFSTACLVAVAALPGIGSAKEPVKQPEDPWTIPTLPAESEFGTSVSARGGVAVAGAPAYSGPGTAWVTEASGAPWPSTELVPPITPEAESFYGQSVVVHDSSTIAVTMPKFAQGSVFVFEKVDAAWNPAELPIDPMDNGHFGVSVAFAADLLLVGDTTSPCMVGFCGRVFQYQKINGWQQVQALAPALPQQNQRFGTAVALQPGSPSRVAVGAPETDTAGAVFLLTDDPVLGWVDVQLSVPDGLVEGDEFGTAVALADDWLLAAAGNTGQVFAYDIQLEQWTDLTALIGPVGAYASLVLAEDLAVVGEPAAADNDGSVTLLAVGNTITHLATIPAPEPGLFGKFGTAVALDGRVLWVGEPGVGAGRVHRYAILASPGEPCVDDLDCASDLCFERVCATPDETTGGMTSGDASSGDADTTGEDPSADTTVSSMTAPDTVGETALLTTSDTSPQEEATSPPDSDHDTGGGVGFDDDDIWPGCTCTLRSQDRAPVLLGGLGMLLLFRRRRPR